MQVNDIAKWIDELQGNISVIKQQLAGIKPGGSGVTFYDLIDAPITQVGDITVEDMSDADFLCFGIGVTASGYDQIFEVYLNYNELKRSGAHHFASGAIGSASGVYSAGAEVSVSDDTTISIVSLGKSKWSEAAKIFYIRKVTIG